MLEGMTIDASHTTSRQADLIAALTAAEPSVRLQAALTLGANPEPSWVDTLVARCAIEPDFYVRDMLTWALIRHPAAVVVPRLLAELNSASAQARSQALHTLSKFRDAGTWPAITDSLLRDADDEVARSAWRAAVVLVPAGQNKALAERLAGQLGRGDRAVQLSLSRALAALGEDAVGALLEQALASPDPRIQAHASATVRLMCDEHAGFEHSLGEAKRIFVLGPEPEAGTTC
jgi:HEAT repeat protein